MARPDLLSAIQPLLQLRSGGQRLDPTQSQAQNQSAVGQSLLGGIPGLGAVAPDASQQKRNIAGLFGNDVRSPIEKINDQLAQSGVALNTSAGLLEAARLTNAAGLSQQALQLTQMAGKKSKEEADQELKRKRDQQIIDLSIKEDERADATDKREDTAEARLERAENRQNITLAINQAAFLRELSQSEARKTAAQDAFVKEFPEDVELAQAVGAGALTLDEARLWKQKGDPQDWPQFLKWAEDNAEKGYGEFLEFKADLQKTVTTPPQSRGISLTIDDVARIKNAIRERFNSWSGDPLPAGYDTDKLLDEARVLMENQPPGQQITIDRALNLIVGNLGQEESTSISPEAKSELEGYGED